MNIFEDVTLEWDGTKYTIPANRIMQCIAKVEDIVTLGDLHRYSDRGTVPMVKLASAFAAALRYAGAKVSDEEVYVGMFKEGEMMKATAEAIGTLLVMMVPPGAVKAAADKKAAEGEAVGKIETPSVT